jgi:hypothetical protein
MSCHLTGGAAADRIAVGEQLASVPESHQSVVEGWQLVKTDEGEILAIPPQLDLGQRGLLAVLEE